MVIDKGCFEKIFFGDKADYFRSGNSGLYDILDFAKEEAKIFSYVEEGSKIVSRIEKDNWKDLLINYFNLNQMVYISEQGIPENLLLLNKYGFDIKFSEPASTSSASMKVNNLYIATFKVACCGINYGLSVTFKYEGENRYPIKGVMVSGFRENKFLIPLDVCDFDFGIEKFYAIVNDVCNQKGLSDINFIHLLKSSYLYFNDTKFRVLCMMREAGII